MDYWSTREWTQVEKDVYDVAWLSQENDLLYVEDAAPEGQSTFEDFKDGRYEVCLERGYRRGVEEDVYDERFEDVEEAVNRLIDDGKL